jgi:hypothetical protein
VLRERGGGDLSFFHSWIRDLFIGIRIHTIVIILSAMIVSISNVTVRIWGGYYGMLHNVGRIVGSVYLMVPVCKNNLN